VIAVVDYGMGNLRSMAKALEHVGAEVTVTADERVLREAERIVLPGVGAFGEAMRNLRESGLVHVLEEEVLRAGKPFLGVCLGMEVLAREGLEHGRHEGLGWVDARVVALEPAEGVRVPHTGWNDVELAQTNGSPLVGGTYYFNHAYHVVADDPSVVAAWTEHGTRVAAAIAFDNVVATQFHPEKSQREGLELLAAFVDWRPQATRTSTP
jgi:imidazole glycerol-phosphate synthase subunit HisH